jgi:UDP-GlcNAc:undecaprenyl-phosphate GlcNAc-1-phosphate transferase
MKVSTRRDPLARLLRVLVLIDHPREPVSWSDRPKSDKIGPEAGGGQTKARISGYCLSRLGLRATVGVGMYLILSLGLFAFVFSLALTPLVRDTFRKLGVMDEPDGTRKIHTAAVPRVGGIAIALSYLAAFGVVLALPFSYRAAVWRALPDVWMLFVAAGIVFATGLVDDLFGLRPWQKLSGQLLAASIAYAAGVQIHIFPGHPFELWWSIPLSIVWLIGCANAFNLIDGLDGLAAGVGLFATITVLLAAFAHHNLELALVTMPLFGCLLGFLRYNFNPASVFLGDCGSLLVGFLLGCFGVLWSQKSATLLGMTAPLMAMSIPLLDVLLSVARRFLRHQRIFGADRRHIHHQLLNRGLTPRRVAVLLYLICGVAATFSLVQNAVHNEFAGLILVLFCLAAWIGIQHLGYTEFATVRQLLFKGAFRRMIDGQTRLQQFEQELTQAGTLEACWTVIRVASGSFGFHQVRLSLRGRIYEEGTPSRTPAWQIRIPLPDGQYANFNRDIMADLDPVILGAFVKVLEKRLNEALTKPGEAVLYETAAANGSGSPRGAQAVPTLRS